MFKENFQDLEIKFGSKTLLSEAFYSFRRLFTIKTAVPLKDKYGRIAIYLGDYGYLVAKKAPYGDVVSVDARLWARCRSKKIPILMYIQTSKYFYRFKPDKIHDARPNMRGDVKMQNFNIHQGVNILNIKKLMSTCKKVEAKNREFQCKLL